MGESADHILSFVKKAVCVWRKANMNAETSAAIFPRTELLSFFYVLLEQGAPPGLIRGCMKEAKRRAHSVVAEDALDDPHIAGLASQLARQVGQLHSQPVKHERVAVLIDLEGEDCSYESLIQHAETIVTEAASQVRKSIAERIKEHHREGTHGDLPIEGDQRDGRLPSVERFEEQNPDDQERRVRSYGVFQSPSL
jgi:hypothetical protein